MDEYVRGCEKMATQYTEASGFKKKYLAPLIVLMLCAVSLTGAAYAYSTSITGHGTIGDEYYSIDLYTDNTGNTVITENINSEEHFQVYTKKIVGGSVEESLSGNYYGSVDETKVTFVTYVKVLSNNTTEGYKYTIDSKAKYITSTTNGIYSSWTESSVKCDVKFYECSDSENTNSITEFSLNTLYKVIITITLPAISGVDLGTADPTELEDKLAYDGKVQITLTATAKTSSS